MILFVIIGIIILVKIYHDTVLPHDVRCLLNKIEREQYKNSHSVSKEDSEQDLIENDIIDMK